MRRGVLSKWTQALDERAREAAERYAGMPWLSFGRARDRLGISDSVLANLLQAGSLRSYVYVADDRRVTRVLLEDIEKLERQHEATRGDEVADEFRDANERDASFWGGKRWDPGIR
jgi:hypothetical protein